LFLAKEFEDLGHHRQADSHLLGQVNQDELTLKIQDLQCDILHKAFPDPQVFYAVRQLNNLACRARLPIRHRLIV